MIWHLFFWSFFVPIFEGGQYQTRVQCETAALNQLVERGYELEHVCELSDVVVD
jgi:hypothetical protein